MSFWMGPKRAYLLFFRCVSVYCDFIFVQCFWTLSLCVGFANIASDAFTIVATSFKKKNSRFDQDFIYVIWCVVNGCLLSLVTKLMCLAPKGLILQKFCVRCLCMFCFMQICVMPDFVVCGWFVVWWLACRVNRRRIEHCF